MKTDSRLIREESKIAKEKEILNNFNSFFKIDEERNTLDTGRVINAKPNLDEYDNMESEE